MASPNDTRTATRRPRSPCHSSSAARAASTLTGSAPAAMGGRTELARRKGRSGADLASQPSTRWVTGAGTELAATSSRRRRCGTGSGRPGRGEGVIDREHPVVERLADDGAGEDAVADLEAGEVAQVLGGADPAGGDDLGLDLGEERLVGGQVGARAHPV